MGFEGGSPIVPPSASIISQGAKRYLIAQKHWVVSVVEIGNRKERVRERKLS